MKYNEIDFLEFFDITQELDKETGTVEYSVSSAENITLIIYMNIYDDRAYFILKSNRKNDLVTFDLQNIGSITCERNKSGLIRFIFHQNNSYEPILIAIIKPTIELILNIK